MTLIEYLNSTGGTQTAFADSVGVSPSFVNQWLSGIRPIPMEKAIAIERATGGIVTCEELLPDIDWRRWRDVTKKSRA